MVKRKVKFTKSKIPWILAVSILLNGLAVLNFALAFAFPYSRVEFIFNGAILVFMFEFLNIHSTGFMSGLDNLSSKSLALALKLAMFGFYIWFARGLLFASMAVSIAFVLSLGSKIVFSMQTQTARKFYLFQFFWFMASVFIFALIPANGINILKLPDNLFWSANPSNIGLWNTYPQYALLWGMAYYFGLIIIQLYLYKTKSKV